MAGIPGLRFIGNFFSEPFDLFKEDNTMTVSITELPNGRFAIVDRNGHVADYARRRDAIRGASRRGFTVA